MAVNEGQASRTRRLIAAGLIVIASLVAFLALASIWVNRQALNTDNWTRTSSQLLEQPVIRDRVAARLTDELYQSVDVQQVLSDALPPRAQVLAAPAANALRTQVEKTARKALARPDVQALWADANRTAHEQLLAVLNGGGTTVSTQNGEVVLNLQDMLAKLQQETGIGGRLRKVLPASATQIRLFRSNQLSAAQTGVKILRPLPIVLLLVSLALFGIAVAIAPGWRRRALRAYGIGFIVVGLATLLARSLGGDAFVSSLAKTAAAEPAIRQVWSIGTELLDQVAVATIGYGIVMVAAAWLAGPTRIATATRRAVAPFWRSPAIAYSGLAIVVLILLWWAPTPAWRNAAMVLILVAPARRRGRGAAAPDHPRVPGRDARGRQPAVPRALGRLHRRQPPPRRVVARGRIAHGPVGDGRARLRRATRRANASARRRAPRMPASSSSSGSLSYGRRGSSARKS